MFPSIFFCKDLSKSSIISFSSRATVIGMKMYSYVNHDLLHLPNSDGHEEDPVDNMPQTKSIYFTTIEIQTYQKLRTNVASKGKISFACFHFRAILDYFGSVDSCKGKVLLTFDDKGQFNQLQLCLHFSLG